MEGLTAITSAADVVAPGVDSFFGVLIGRVIPNQRNERLIEYVARLSRRLRLAEGAVENLNEAFAAMASNLSLEQRALFEEGAYAATRSTTQERIESVAKIVGDGLSSADARALDQGRLLQLIDQLSEDDVIVLMSHTMVVGRDQAWRDRHAAVLLGPRVHMQASREDHDKNTLRELRLQRLVNLGVLEVKADSSGRSTRRDLSTLGRLVLRRLDLLTEDQV